MLIYDSAISIPCVWTHIAIHWNNSNVSKSHHRYWIFQLNEIENKKQQMKKNDFEIEIILRKQVSIALITNKTSPSLPADQINFLRLSFQPWPKQFLYEAIDVKIWLIVVKECSYHLLVVNSRFLRISKFSSNAQNINCETFINTEGFLLCKQNWYKQG